MKFIGLFKMIVEDWSLTTLAHAPVVAEVTQTDVLTTHCVRVKAVLRIQARCSITTAGGCSNLKNLRNLKTFYKIML